jgi:acetyl esterase/lipase
VSKKPVVIELWPDGAPGRVGKKAESEVPSDDNVRRITNVSRPTLTIYRAKQGKTPSPAVLVCPGGAYRILSWDKEGTEVAEWLNSLGVTAAVLKYRVPQNREGAFQDAQRALRLLRHRAKEWKIDSRRIGVLGFSAGGHLSARLSTGYRKGAYKRVDEADAVSCRPDFTVLLYPAYLCKEKTRYELPDEITVTRGAPPAVLVQTQDDRRHIDSSIAYYLALKKAGVSAELHLYPSGGHGYGLRPTGRPVSKWPELVETWFRARGILGGKPAK